MNSSIYICSLSHVRNKPARNAFRYEIYMMYLDLDELETLSKNFCLFSYNKWNVLSFNDSDHFKFVKKHNKIYDKIAQENVKVSKEKYQDKSTKERIQIMISEIGLGFELGKVMIMTNLRNFGYIFNPVSFYFCFDKAGVLRAMFSEVNNTFRDQKMYYMETDSSKDKVFRSVQKKNYYISPFIDHDNDISWEFELPAEKLFMRIDSLKNNEATLKTVLSGKRKKISNWTLLYLQLRYPLITLGIIIMIHYQALKLYFKKVGFRKKKETDVMIADQIKK